MKLVEALKDIHFLAVDTAPFIYYVEKHPNYFECMQQIFQNVENGVPEVFTSIITLTEVLMKPIQAQNTHLQKEYRDLLLNTDYVQTIRLDAPIATKAAELRAQYNLRTPDAIQVASSIYLECDAFLTNDKGIKRVSDIRVILLDELELDTDDDT